MINFGRGERSHWFAIPAVTAEGDACTLIVWREVTMVGGQVITRVAISLDSTWRRTVVLTPEQAREVSEGIWSAATNKPRE